VSLADYDAMRNQPAAHALVFVNIPNTATYFPALYLPAALGLAIGLLLKASPFVCLMLGRAGMLSAFLLLGSLALIVAAYGEALLLTVLLLPMTLFLAGSLNEDGVLIALACLSAAAFTRDPMRQPKFRLLGIAVLVVLLGLALLPLGAPGFWRRAGQMVVASLPVLLWVGIIIAFVVVPFGRPPYHPGPLFTGDPERLLVATNSAANLHILLAQPTRFVSLPWQTLWYWHAPLYQAMIGILGLLNLHLTDQYYNAWSFALVAALLGLVFTRRPAPFNPLDGALVLVVFIVACWTLTISLYLSWTDVGAAMIDGLQGRYFLLFLPFIALAVPAWRSRFLLPAIVPALPALALGIYDLGYLPMKLVVFYYVH
jgi:hypothetical protein